MHHVLAVAAVHAGRAASGTANRVVGMLLDRRYGGNTGAQENVDRNRERLRAGEKPDRLGGVWLERPSR